MLGADSAWRSHSWQYIAEAVCGQSMSGVDAAVLRVAVFLEYTSRVWLVFRQVACAIGGVTRGAWCV